MLPEPTAEKLASVAVKTSVICVPSSAELPSESETNVHVPVNCCAEAQIENRTTNTTARHTRVRFTSGTLPNILLESFREAGNVSPFAAGSKITN